VSRTDSVNTRASETPTYDWPLSYEAAPDHHCTCPSTDRQSVSPYANCRAPLSGLGKTGLNRSGLRPASARVDLTTGKA